MHPHSRSTHNEAGYVLIGVIFFVALVLLSLAIAAPKVAESIQRDRELELVHRGEQYKRALKLYYKKFGAYPTSIEQLESTNNVRYLRKRYLDPITGKDDWKLIHIGEAHLRPLGFFGQPLGIAGAGSSGLGSASTLGQGSQIGGGLGSSAGGLSSGSSPLGGGIASTGNAPVGGGGGIYAGVDNSGSGAGTGTGSNTGSTGSTFGSSSSSFGSSGGSFGSSGTGTSGSGSQTFGGGPIVGVVVASEKHSIVEYKLKKVYKDWEFVYDPAEEATLGAGGTPNLNGPGAPSGSPGVGPTSGSGGLNGGSGGFGGGGIGGGSGFGGTGLGSGSGGVGSGSGFGSGSGSGTGSGNGSGSGGTTPQ